MPNVAILGGGVGGMSAAHMLQRSGCQVTVFEKRNDYVGGKARSEDIPGTDTCPGNEKLPGEHGFRFFPGFYQHITETLKEIPFNGRTVFDNLVSTETVQLSQAGMCPPITLPLSLPLNPWEILKLFDSLRLLSGRLTEEETDFFKERVWQLMTSCEERFLGEYEKMSWKKYTKADQFSTNYNELLVQGLTRSLTAAQAEIASARTIGNMLIQMLYTMIDGTPENADLVLNAPTNEAWLNPWYEYLVNDLGVDYHKDRELREIVMTGNAEGSPIDFVKVSDGSGNEIQVSNRDFDYFVLAVPIDIASALFKGNADLLGADPNLQNVIDLVPDIRWMNGIQFFLNQPFDMHCGHTIFASSNWAITSISQIQFWPNYDMTNRYCGRARAILSCAISDWYSRGNFNDLRAMDCTREEVCVEAFKQIQNEVNSCGKDVLTNEMLELTFLDSSIYDLFPSPARAQQFRADGIDPDRFFTQPDNIPIKELLKQQVGNHEPMLVNLKCKWHLRPSAKTKIPNLVLASDYVKTNIDLASMEGANEAAREATNYIIDHSGSGASPQKIKKLRTPQFFRWLQSRDRRRWNQGKPWKNPNPFPFL